MSAGDLSSRLVVDNDPDLQPVADSFNEMADSLQDRIAREARFTADVSHELRTPLTAAGSAMSLAMRSELPERAQIRRGHRRRAARPARRCWPSTCWRSRGSTPASPSCVRS